MKTICAHCGQEFKKPNGSSRYCPGGECYNEAKKSRQKIVDDLIKSFRRGIYQNLKIFKELLPSAGSVSASLTDLLRDGLAPDAYYGCKIDQNKNMWYCVGPYLFNITNESPKRVIIYKN